MTATATLTPTNAQLDNELNQMVLEGKILEAFDRFYDEKVVMQENGGTPTVGKPANRDREVKFVDSIEQFHGAQVVGSGTGGDRSYSEWAMDVTFKGGIRVKLEQVAARQWRNGKIVHERFYFNTGNA
ncbi:MAG: SnoaL-like domain-containing protein [Gemmatimonadales bacterium]